MKVLAYRVAWAGIVVSLISMAGLVATSSGADEVATVPHAVSACTAGDLVNWLNTDGNGTAGSIYYQIEFTNVSTKSCTLFGYPGVSAVNAAGHQIGAAAARVPPSPHTITLAAGRSAEAAWQVTFTANYPTASCRPATAVGVRVYAPNASVSDVIPFPFSVCSKSSTASLHIEAVKSS